MSGIFGDFSMNATKETEGIEVTYSANADGTVPTFRVARMSPNNVRYTKAVERITRPYRRQIDLKTLATEKAMQIRREIFVSSILLGWDHVQDASGKEIAYSGEAAMKLFEALPDLFDDLEKHANDASLFRADEQERDAKN